VTQEESTNDTKNTNEVTADQRRAFVWFVSFVDNSFGAACTGRRERV
jgi:hypothetical protein